MKSKCISGEKKQSEIVAGENLAKSISGKSAWHQWRKRSVAKSK